MVCSTNKKRLAASICRYGKEVSSRKGLLSVNSRRQAFLLDFDAAEIVVSETADQLDLEEVNEIAGLQVEY